jgi:hypothetical protein
MVQQVWLSVTVHSVILDLGRALCCVVYCDCSDVTRTVHFGNPSQLQVTPYIFLSNQLISTLLLALLEPLLFHVDTTSQSILSHAMSCSYIAFTGPAVYASANGAH